MVYTLLTILTLLVNGMEVSVIANNLSKCVDKIVQSDNFSRHLSYHLGELYGHLLKEGNLLTLISSKSDPSLISVPYLTANNDCLPVLMINTGSIQRDPKPPVLQLPSDSDFIIILLQDTNSIGDVIVKENIFYLNYRANFLVIIVITSRETKENPSSIFDELWRIRVIKVTVIFINICEGRLNTSISPILFNRTISLSSFNPISSKIYSKNLTLDDVQNSKEILDIGYSTGKIDNLQGYSLKTTHLYTKYEPFFSYWKSQNGTYMSEGLYHGVLVELQKYMNYTIECVFRHDWYDYGFKLDNGTWSGITGDIVRKEVDFGYSSLGFLKDKNEVLDYSEYISHQPTTVLVPRSKQIPSSVSLMLTFSSQLWFSIITCFLVVALVFRFLGKYFNLKTHQNIWRIFLVLFGVVLQVSVARQPCNVQMRMVFIAWVLFSLVIASIYEGGVVSVLTIPRYYPNIESLEQLVNSDMAVAGIKFYSKIFNDETDNIQNTLHKRFVVNDDYDELIGDIVHGKRIGIIGSKMRLKYYARKAHTCMSCTTPFHIIKETLSTELAGIPLSKGSPFLLRFNVLIRRMHDSGLIVKWLEDLVRESARIYAKCDTECSRPLVISVYHLIPGFYVLLLGYVLALSITIIEVILFKYHLK